ncbi:hypothetical protein ACLMNJ_21800 [Streptomyces seoulensis]
MSKAFSVVFQRIVQRVCHLEAAFRHIGSQPLQLHGVVGAWVLAPIAEAA